jgi:hypothetical protein
MADVDGDVLHSISGGGGSGESATVSARIFVGRPLQVIQSHLSDSPELEKDPNLRPESAKALLDRLADCDDVEPWSAEEARTWWRARKTA